MDKKFEVFCTQRCEHCENGVIVHPAWRAYWADGNGGGQSLSTEQTDIEWFNNYYGWNAQSVEDFPPEEIDCPECNGTGEIRDRVLLVDALSALGVDAVDTMCACGLARRLAICLAHEVAYHNDDASNATRIVLSEARDVLGLQDGFGSIDSLCESMLKELICEKQDGR